MDVKIIDDSYIIHNLKLYKKVSGGEIPNNVLDYLLYGSSNQITQQKEVSSVAPLNDKEKIIDYLQGYYIINKSFPKTKEISDELGIAYGNVFYHMKKVLSDIDGFKDNIRKQCPTGVTLHAWEQIKNRQVKNKKDFIENLKYTHHYYIDTKDNTHILVGDRYVTILGKSLFQLVTVFITNADTLMGDRKRDTWQKQELKECASIIGKFLEILDTEGIRQ